MTEQGATLNFRVNTHGIITFGATEKKVAHATNTECDEYLQYIQRKFQSIERPGHNKAQYNTDSQHNIPHIYIQNDNILQMQMYHRP